MLKQLHATCVEINGKGVLLTGKSGSGKTELALHLINLGAQLVADDQVILDTQTLQASCPPVLRDKMEMRGVGIIPIQTKTATHIDLCVQLCPRSQTERFPLQSLEVEGIPAVRLPGHDITATADKIMFLCRQKNIRAFLKTACSSPAVCKKNCPLPKL